LKSTKQDVFSLLGLQNSGGFGFSFSQGHRIHKERESKRLSSGSAQKTQGGLGEDVS